MPKHRQDNSEIEEPTLEEPSLEEDVRGLFSSTRAAFDSEIEYQKARAALALRLALRIAALGALALALVFFLLMALIMGSLLGLAALLGPWGAMGVVVGLLLLITLWSVVTVKRSVSRLTALFSGSEPDA
ncbi:phage holin family protein [Novosphingobium sp. KACC 22771]|uniref:phage holin family protein n=1 Tax=Novosphingobium sp. KACC 22771 TaxID=3025670 RepID=UPI002365E966|nr:phage holin family protein [Novosphingobium sp. KACC 22771]WDF71644.1 phage holin family protein [Novosphingobium sp. KACC 22771]